MGLVTPEAEILSVPQVIAFTNSMSSLARHGVSSRSYGPGDNSEVPSSLTFSVAEKDPVDKLELLLTNGRLSNKTRAGELKLQ